MLKIAKNFFYKNYFCLQKKLNALTKIECNPLEEAWFLILTMTMELNIANLVTKKGEPTG